MCFIIQNLCFIIQNLCKIYIEITLYYPNFMFIYTNLMFIYTNFVFVNTYFYKMFFYFNKLFTFIVIWILCFDAQKNIFSYLKKISITIFFGKYYNLWKITEITHRFLQRLFLPFLTKSHHLGKINVLRLNT